MTDKQASAIEGNNLEDIGLQDHVEHWTDVLDHWVKSVDARLGRQDGGPPQPEQPDGGPRGEP